LPGTHDNKHTDIASENCPPNWIRVPGHYLWGITSGEYPGRKLASEPIVFIIRNKISEDKTDEFRKHYRDSVPLTNAGKPGTLAQLAYENDQATEVTIVHLFPSADALDQQIQGADERSKKTYEFIEPIGIEVFGTPNPATLEKMNKIAGSGVVVSISPHYIDGFIR
jgi:quinol monooxygenase YgiN